jgi:hypothetical protein
MVPKDQPRFGAAHLHARHARVTIRINEVNVSGDKNVLMIRAACYEDQRTEQYDLNDV